MKGKWYRPAADPDYEAYGVASWYGRDFHGKPTANGERFDMNRLSAAHTTLPMPSLVEVANLNNGRRIVVRVNDRGPFADDRLIDLSREAARQLGFERKGLSRVRVRYIGPAPLMAKAPKFNQRQMDIPPVAPSARASLVRTTPTTSKHATRQTKASRKTVTSPKRASTIPVFAPLAPAGSSPPGHGPSDQTSKSSTEQLYLIRVAALSRLDNIEALKRQLSGIGQLRLARIETASGSVLYRINMGPFTSLETANKRLEAVRDAGYKDAGLITLKP